MSKELKPCHLLDRLREWFELYGNQNHERAEEELHLAIDELYEYQQKDKTIADLEAKLAESEKQRQHLKDWLDDEILTSVDHESYNNTINEYEEQIAELNKQLAEANKEIKNMSVSSDWQSLLILKQEMEILQTENKVLKQRNQDKISFTVEQLNATYRLLHEKATSITGTGVNAVRLYTINEVFKSQIEQLNAANSTPLKEKEGE